MMLYYVTDADDRIVGKFQNMSVKLADGYTKHSVESVAELSDITVDSWDNSLIE